MLSGKKAVIFDMDGTLTDSMWIWPEVDRIFLKKYHLTPPPGFAKALEGKSYTETAQYFLDVFPELSCSLESLNSVVTFNPSLNPGLCCLTICAV